jgi:hypothetical protein
MYIFKLQKFLRFVVVIPKNASTRASEEVPLLRRAL